MSVVIDVHPLDTGRLLRDYRLVWRQDDINAVSRGPLVFGPMIITCRGCNSRFKIDQLGAERLADGTGCPVCYKRDARLD